LLLFNDKKEFVAFGKIAMDKYCNLKLDEEDESFYFFQNFKMTLYDEKVNSFSLHKHLTYIS